MLLEARDSYRKNKDAVDEILDRYDLKWLVKKNQLISIEGEITDSYGIFRQDNGMWMGTVKSAYIPKQNRDFIAAVYEAGKELDLEISHAETLGKGKKVFALLKLPPTPQGWGRNIMAINSHDGMNSIQFGSCFDFGGNIWNKIYPHDMKMLRHNRYIDDGRTVDICKKMIALSIESDEKITHNLNVFTKIPSSLEIVNRLFSRAFSIPYEDVIEGKMSPVKAKYMYGLGKSLSNEIDKYGSNLFSVLSGFVGYNTHFHKSKRKLHKDYMYVGRGYAINSLVYHEIIRWLMRTDFRDELEIPSNYRVWGKKKEENQTTETQ